LKAACLKKLGYAQTNQIMRSWYLTGARELEGKIDTKKMLQFSRSSMVGIELPPDQIFNAWRYVLYAERAGTKHLALQLSITDIDEHWILELRNSILDIKRGEVNDVSPVLETTAAQLNAFHKKGEVADNFNGPTEGVTVLKEMIGYLDREIPGIYMHLR
jgi:alkyl sulfatase BDS1-like metallo-beta-lactamase superfamily hydrolase